MVDSREMVLKAYQSINKCTVDTEYNDATKACVTLALCEPSVVAESSKMNEDMVKKII